MPSVATMPELNSKQSASMPSLKITPFSDMCEVSESGDCMLISPHTNVVDVVLLGKGSRTVKFK
jgi:hypothetical protein